jgi:archaemetzincin
MSGVRVWWLASGGADALFLSPAIRAIDATYGLAAKFEVISSRPDSAFDPRRNQHSSTQILHWLSERYPKGAVRLLAITDYDLFIPILTFVFGEAELRGRTAVVSFARLLIQDGAFVPRDRAAQRLAKEVVHELGHTFGLLHCKSYRCVMARSASLKDVDMKEPALCPDCKSRYSEFAIGKETSDE